MRSSVTVDGTGKGSMAGELRRESTLPCKLPTLGEIVMGSEMRGD